jgi:hypothetical protein
VTIAGATTGWLRTASASRALVRASRSGRHPSRPGYQTGVSPVTTPSGDQAIELGVIDGAVPLAAGGVVPRHARANRSS